MSIRHLCLVVQVIALASVVAAPAAAQTRPRPPAATAPASPEEEAEHAAIRQLRALYEQAIREGKPEMLAPHVASDFRGVMVTGRLVKNVEELQRYWADIQGLIGPGGRYTTTLNPERSVILGDIALARGSTDDVVVTDEGREFRFTSLWTATLQKVDGVWKVRQMQGSIDPVDNAFVREFGRRALVPAAAIAGAVGLAIGVVVGLFISRRRARA
jgi:ketosteroid isomerase-like protein